MEFRLNKVEPETRIKVEETTNPSKIHTKSSIIIDKDNKNNKNKSQESFSDELEKKKKEMKQKKISVNAVKVEEVDVTAFKNELESKAEAEVMGNILDVKR